MYLRHLVELMLVPVALRSTEWCVEKREPKREPERDRTRGARARMRRLAVYLLGTLRPGRVVALKRDPTCLGPDVTVRSDEDGHVVLYFLAYVSLSLASSIHVVRSCRSYVEIVRGPCLQTSCLPAFLGTSLAASSWLIGRKVAVMIWLFERGIT